MFSSKILNWLKKFYHKKKKSGRHQKNFLTKNIFKIASQYLYVFILFNTVSYLKLDFKLNIDTKMCTFITWRKFWKHGENFPKIIGNPVS